MQRNKLIERLALVGAAANAACRLGPCIADTDADTFVARSAIFGQKEDRKIINAMRGALAG